MAYSYINHPLTHEKLSIFENNGKQLLKSYIKLLQTGGAKKSNDNLPCSVSEGMIFLNPGIK